MKFALAACLATAAAGTAASTAPTEPKECTELKTVEAASTSMENFAKQFESTTFPTNKKFDPTLSGFVDTLKTVYTCQNWKWLSWPTSADCSAWDKSAAGVAASGKIAAYKYLSSSEHLVGYVETAYATLGEELSKGSCATQHAANSKVVVDTCEKAQNDAMCKMNLIVSQPAASNAAVGIIIGCVCGALCLIGLAVWWFCFHKKGDSGDDNKDGMNNFDDMYMAYVDRDMA